MQRFKSPGHSQRFLAAYGLIAHYFRPRRYLLPAPAYRQEMWHRFDREHSLFFSGYLPRLVSESLSVARKDPVKGAIVFGAAQGQHLVGVGHIPPGP
jgi:hypothetical protein